MARSTGWSRYTTISFPARACVSTTTTAIADGTTATTRPRPGGSCIAGGPTSCCGPAGISYQLADSGEDQGRLTEVFDDGLSQLAAEAPCNAQPDAAGRVQHAIALFRGRTATIEDKRSAIITLAGILEERRTLIKAELTSADEGVLFQIANKFAIRHRDDRQLADYDPAFLNWIFWWYLATVDLISRIIGRQQGEDSSALSQT